MECAICAIAKKENRYLYEWASYHIKQGFSHIYIYDNNDIDGERITPSIFGNYSSMITIFDVRGERFVQKTVYQRCYEEEVFDWCAFIDIDEFITFSKESEITNINDFLRDKTSWDAIHLNWLCYGDNGYVNWDERPVLERFTNHKRPISFFYTYITHSENEHIKSIIKKGINIDWNKETDTFSSNPHTPWGLQTICDARGKKRITNSPFAPIVLENAYIRHFTTKTIAEYMNKINRQCADCDNVDFYSYTKFFRLNFPSPRKINWMKRNVPNANIPRCIIEYLKFSIINYNLPFRSFFKSLRK